MGVAPATCLPDLENRHQKYLNLAKYEQFYPYKIYRKQTVHPETLVPLGDAVPVSEDNDLHNITPEMTFFQENLSVIVTEEYCQLRSEYHLSPYN